MWHGPTSSLDCKGVGWVVNSFANSRSIGFNTASLTYQQCLRDIPALIGVVLIPACPAMLFLPTSQRPFGTMKLEPSMQSLTGSLPPPTPRPQNASTKLPRHFKRCFPHAHATAINCQSLQSSQNIDQSSDGKVAYLVIGKVGKLERQQVEAEGSLVGCSGSRADMQLQQVMGVWHRPDQLALQVACGSQECRPLTIFLWWGSNEECMRVDATHAEAAGTCEDQSNTFQKTLACLAWSGLLTFRFPNVLYSILRLLRLTHARPMVNELIGHDFASVGRESYFAL